MRSASRFALLSVAAAVLSGCVSKSVDLTAISTKPLVGQTPVVVAENVSARDCGGMFDLYGSYARAVRRAIASAPGALIDVSLSAQESKRA